MPVRGMYRFLSVAVVLLLVADSYAGLKSPPQVSQSNSQTTITFELTAPADVEVAVLDANNRVVRHLAAGVVGKEQPPKPLAASLKQSLKWDGKDDFGKQATGGPFKVRVRSGMKTKLGKVVREPAEISGQIYGLATDDQGNLYVATGVVYSNLPVYSIKVLDPKGKYLRTIFPMPNTLSVEDTKEYGTGATESGNLKPKNYEALSPYVQPGGVMSFIGNRVRDGQLWLVNTRNRICRIDATTGKPVLWNSGAVAIGASGGPLTWAVSPDNKSLYQAGWWNWRNKTGSREDGVIHRIEVATGKSSDFLKIDVPEDSFWLKESNGWYMFKNWGRKNGLAALHGMAVDQQGQVYVCDRVNQQLAVYDKSGKQVGSTKVEWPDQVVLGEQGTVYVVTRKIVDGYKAINQFEVLKLSSAIDGKVLASHKLVGKNAPQVAVSTSGRPPVIWVSNVGKEGNLLTAIEDRGSQFEVVKEIDTSGTSAIVKLWVDPLSDDLYVNDGWSRLTKYNGNTGQKKTLPIKAIDMTIGPDRNIYLMGQKGWKEPVYRCDLELNPVPFKGTDKPTTQNEIYGRFGTGWSNKGIAVGHDGRLFVRHMYDWAKYHVIAIKPDGTVERHDRIEGGILGPLDSATGGIRLDLQGNFYVGMSGLPTGAGKADTMEGCVVKISSAGGGLVDGEGKGKGLAFGKRFFEGAVKAYPHLAPHNSRGCVCKEARFDVDNFGRVYVPSVLDFCVRVYDNEGNLITRLGHYGNLDAQLKPTDPQSIALGWPMTVGVNQLDRLYVSDVLNQSIVRVDISYDSEETVAIK